MPSKKKQPKNALYMYASTTVRQELRDEGRPSVPIHELIAIASPRFKLLSEKEQERYKEMAKREKEQLRKDKTNIFTSSGASVAELEEEQREAKEQDIKMKQDITTNVEFLKSKGKLMTEKFYILDFNIFLETEEKPSIFVPAEMCVVEFCIKDGITNVFHQFVHPGTIPLGYRFKATENSQLTHKIPLENTPDLGRIPFESLIIRLRNFINHMDQKNVDPPFYTMAGEKDKCMFLLQRIYDDAKDRRAFPFKVYDLAFLLHRLREASQAESARLTTLLCEDVLTKSHFDYTASIACKWHEGKAKEDEDIETHHCVQSKVKAKAFLLLESVCKYYDVEIEPEKHCPAIAMESPCITKPPSRAKFSGSNLSLSRSTTSTPTLRTVSAWNRSSSRETLQSGYVSDQMSCASDSNFSSITTPELPSSTSFPSKQTSPKKQTSMKQTYSDDVTTPEMPSLSDQTSNDHESVASTNTGMRQPKTLPKTLGGGAWGKPSTSNDDSSSVGSLAGFPSLQASVRPPPGFDVRPALMQPMGRGRGAAVVDINPSAGPAAVPIGRGRGLMVEDSSHTQLSIGRGRLLDDAIKFKDLKLGN